MLREDCHAELCFAERKFLGILPVTLAATLAATLAVTIADTHEAPLRGC